MVDGATHLKKVDSNNSSLFASSHCCRFQQSRFYGLVAVPIFNGLVAVPVHGHVAVSFFQSISTKEEENDLYITITEIRTHDLPHPS